MSENTRTGQQPLISVVIPCYNTAEYLPQCIESLERQTIGIGNLELIFVDDASTDGGGTWNCIVEFERKYPESVTAVRLERNMRQGGAMNIGLSYANADYVGFVASDDWIEPEMYEKLYQCVRENGCDIADCRIMMDFPDGREYVYRAMPEKYIRYEKSVIEGGSHWVGEFLENGYGGSTASGIYRKNLITENNVYFPEQIRYEDNYWQYVLLLYVRSFCHLPNDFYHYRQHTASTVHRQNDAGHLDRLDIELMKLNTYRRLGVFERFEREIEWDFLGYYYLNTVQQLWTMYDEPPYEIYVKMTETVRELFPDYQRNPYLQKEGENLNRILIDLIDRKLNRQQFLAAGELITDYARAEIAQGQTRRRLLDNMEGGMK